MLSPGYCGRLTLRCCGGVKVCASPFRAIVFVRFSSEVLYLKTYILIALDFVSINLFGSVAIENLFSRCMGVSKSDTCFDIMLPIMPEKALSHA